jgi:Zn-dependent protease
VFTNRLRLFTLLGFSVSIDLSWIFLAILVTWSLAAGLFPAFHPGLERGTYWAMGVAGLVGLAFSIVIHEFAHAVVARAYDMPIRGITLFIFGGVAEMRDEPSGPRGEFLMAIAGPIVSVLVGGAFYVLAMLFGSLGAAVAVVGVLGYLGWINIVLAVFNMVPAFPLDGGRVLRAAIWGWKGDYLGATRIASRFGKAFGFLLVGLAVLSVLSGNLIGGMWWFLIGLFVQGAAEGTYRQTLMGQILSDVPVSRFAVTDPVTVAPSLPLETLIDDFFYRHSFRMFPVVEGGRLVGCVELSDVRGLPREAWGERRVADIMRPCDEENTVSPDLGAAEALRHMARSGRSRLLLARGDRLAGIVSQSDVMRFLAVRLDLAGDEAAAGSASARGSTRRAA